MKQNLFFNILTFDWPKGPVNLYYSHTNQGTGQELYFTLFPNEVEQIFPGIGGCPLNSVQEFEIRVKTITLDRHGKRGFRFTEEESAGTI